MELFCFTIQVNKTQLCILLKITEKLRNFFKYRIQKIYQSNIHLFILHQFLCIYSIRFVLGPSKSQSNDVETLC